MLVSFICPICRFFRQEPTVRLAGDPGDGGFVIGGRWQASEPNANYFYQPHWPPLS